MTRNARFYFKLGISVIIGCALVGYGFYQSRDFREGPTISIIEPTNGETATGTPLMIKGSVKNIAAITLNDRPITVDEKGNFSEKSYPQDGYNIFKMEASDKFKRKITKLIEVVYIPTAQSSTTRRDFLMTNISTSTASTTKNSAPSIKPTATTTASSTVDGR